MQGEGDDHGAFLLTNGRWMQEPVGFRSPLVARATAGEGGREDGVVFLLRKGGWMEVPVGFRSPLVARATADEGASDARRPPGGAQQLALVTMVKQISLREI